MREPKLHVAKDGTETWRVRFRLDKKQTSETFESRKAALRFAGWLDNYGAERATELLALAQGANTAEMTVAEWCRKHVSDLSGVTQGTISKYHAYIEQDFGDIGELPLSALTPDAVAAWIRRMTATGASGKTMRNKHGFLSAALKRAVLSGHIPSNPCAGSKIPDTITEPMVFLTHDEYTRLLGCFTPHWRPMVETMFGTGLRWGEITALRVSDLDLDTATLHVVRAWKYTASQPVLGAPKSRRSRRTIDLAPETVTLLRAHVTGRAGDEFVFVNQRGGPVRSGTFHNNVWQPALALANGIIPMRPRGKGKSPLRINRELEPLNVALGKRPRVHDARHTCASWLLASGIPINYVQAHLGHESIKTTVDRYGHIMPAKRSAVSMALSAALSASQPELMS